jgi:hypothetical protein
LERFEITLRMRNYFVGVSDLVPKSKDKPTVDDDMKYFVPSLLLPYDPKTDSAAMQFWLQLAKKYVQSK